MKERKKFLISISFLSQSQETQIMTQWLSIDTFLRYFSPFYSLKLISDVKIQKINLNFFIHLLCCTRPEHYRIKDSFARLEIKIEFISFICPKKSLSCDIESQIFPFLILDQLQAHASILSIATDCVIFARKEEICINLHRKYKYMRRSFFLFDFECHINFI